MFSGLRSHKVNAGHTRVNHLIGTLREVCTCDVYLRAIAVRLSTYIRWSVSNSMSSREVSEFPA